MVIKYTSNRVIFKFPLLVKKVHLFEVAPSSSFITVCKRKKKKEKEKEVQGSYFDFCYEKNSVIIILIFILHGLLFRFFFQPKS